MLCGVALLAAVRAMPATQDASVVVVKWPGGVERVPLVGPRRTIEAHGCTVLVAEGRVCVARSDCPNQCCVNAGWKSRPGEAIVCVPNQVIVSIAGGPPAYDALGY